MKAFQECYELLEEKEIPECGGVSRCYRHKKTGAQVFTIKNQDKNKVFYIAFRTTPGDDTGVAHILEHSVLCGSEKFPLKDPFVELAKGSLNTFLNAMTYPDKTVYPVASCNDKDFMNLMDVYMDAVLHPNIYEEKKIFQQEGWHYELSETGELSYNGVVYNEMKGAFSNPESLLERYTMHALFPHTTYGFESGGAPESIPDLSREAFLDFHRKYYHPSNAYLYLWERSRPLPRRRKSRSFILWENGSPFPAGPIFPKTMSPAESCSRSSTWPGSFWSSCCWMRRERP